MASCIRFVDLFSGIGGFHVGLKDFGTCVLACEIDANARSVYQSNFPDTPICNDVTEIKELPDHDMITAGFPCQPFSVAGRRLGFEDDRGGMFSRILWLARQHSTSTLLLENVPFLLKHDQGKTFATIKAALENEGYAVSFSVLNAADFGVPQERKRLFIVARREGKNIDFPIGNMDRVPIKAILENDVDGEELAFKHKDRIPDPIPKEGRIPLVNPQGKLHQCDYLVRSSKPAPTMTYQIYAVTKSLKVIWPELRFLSAREVARIGGFPDDFKLHPNRNRVYEQIGNSVAPPVVTAIASKLFGDCGQTSEYTAQSSDR
ncbi:DNA cytosine methyltransferase [Thalassoroseus pseudoceratinae]|uniref:DNA cytosine methyltransferase n=1 Tax=Thalassoroseus pseudoceratinae TaxID=2713176 RepID=UPI0021BCDBBA|nr:DNA cytosine methyltransferase [Thalassoroseus pseudoceratinae]